VVDGGKPQVNAAAKALRELGITDVALCGLAKRLEEVWLPNNSEPIIFPRHSEALYLLQKLRDEAHRFAINFHRSKRSRVMLESLLDEVPGLGEIRRKSLLTHFGSVTALKAATVDELASVPGIGGKMAQTIVEQIKNQDLPLNIDMQTGEILDA
jgi:excinuclease ABC subunit C